ncbi:MAG: hypothetical protein AAGH15_27185 [Myxococcota bacterium]
MDVLDLAEEEFIRGLRDGLVALVDAGARRLFRQALGRAHDEWARQHDAELVAAHRSSTEANNRNLLAQQELVRMKTFLEELQASLANAEAERDEARAELRRIRERGRMRLRRQSEQDLAALRASTRPPEGDEP